MKLIKSKKGVALLAALVVAVVAAVGAYAYFTTTGSGSGSATVGTSSNLTLAGTSASTLYPGTTSDISFTALNTSPGHQQLGTIYLAGVHACASGSSWNTTNSDCEVGGAGAPTAEILTCESVDPGNAADANASQFYMQDVVSNQDFGPGASPQTVTLHGTLKFHNLAVSQDQCKNASLYLSFATR
jgi:hypothetical protein